jgi:hypothetical protein
MKRKRRLIFCSSIAIGSLFLSSLAVASLLPGGPEIFNTMNRVVLKNPLESIMGGRSDQPWSELPGTINLPTNGGLFGSSAPWSEGIPGQIEQTASNYLLCQLVGDFGSLPIAIPGLPTSQCSSASQGAISNLPIGTLTSLTQLLRAGVKSQQSELPDLTPQKFDKSNLDPLKQLLKRMR